MSLPFFSVIIPIFNKEKHLVRTVDSVLRQAFQQFELLLVLDPSTDGSNALAESFTDARIRLFYRSEPGPGGYAARNLGVKKAVAEWICFLDADDWWTTNHLQLLYKAITDHPKQQLFLTGFALEQAGQQRLNGFLQMHLGQPPFVLSLEAYLNKRPMCTINFAVNRQAFLTAGLFPAGKFNRGGDHETWLRLWWDLREAVYIPQCTAIYNQDVEGNVSKMIKHYTYDHPVYFRISDLIPVNELPSIDRALKIYSNNSIISGLKRKAKAGVLRNRDVLALYPEVMSSRLYYMYRCLALLPSFVQRQVFLSKRIYD